MFDHFEPLSECIQFLGRFQFAHLHLLNFALQTIELQLNLIRFLFERNLGFPNLPGKVSTVFFERRVDMFIGMARQPKRT